MPRKMTSTRRNDYVAGLRNAEAKGYAAAEDPQFEKSDCPYKRTEHRYCWLDGFSRRRTEINNLGRVEPDEVKSSYPPEPPNAWFVHEFRLR
jgi:ribosome modulation factor